VRLEGARILIVDDHPDLVENLEEILEAEGATVFTAASAQAARARAKEGFDVALVDVRLPDAHGPMLVPELKGDDGLRQVLLVTGHASIQDAIEAVKAGAYAYVLKPFDPDDLLTTVQHALEDVRLRARATSLQHALERSEEALRTMVDTVQALLLVLDVDHRVVQANPAVAAATGRPLEQIVGQRWIDSCVPPRARAGMQQALEKVRTGASAVTTESIVLRRIDDDTVEERTISWSLAGLGRGNAFRIYASGMDVTDVRELERRTQLAEKLAAVGTVSAGLAHEIRNPLNAATLQLQLLERRVRRISEDAGVLEPLDTVRQEIARLANLVTDFLTFARPTALDLVQTNLVDIARGVVGLLQPVAAERNVVLSLHADGEPVRVEADVQRIKQVLLNLVRNALDAVPGDTGRVDLHIERDGAGARITVRDNGPGVDKALAARVFEPFFTTKEMGTGLGMAITHKVVDLHGGAIGIQNEAGAVFTITLPPRPPTPV
jgi:PAS domain S-box-containing protein